MVSEKYPSPRDLWNLLQDCGCSCSCGGLNVTAFIKHIKREYPNYHSDLLYDLWTSAHNEDSRKKEFNTATEYLPYISEDKKIWMGDISSLFIDFFKDYPHYKSEKRGYKFHYIHPDYLITDIKGLL